MLNALKVPHLSATRLVHPATNLLARSSCHLEFEGGERPISRGGYSKMGVKSRFLSSCFLAAALASSVVGAACAHHYRVYDPYYSDYHVWNDNEVVYYHQWARENHYDEHRDFRHIPPEQQKQYWTWRHSHGDNDHH
jgi:hypothetical protein